MLTFCVELIDVLRCKITSSGLLGMLHNVAVINSIPQLYQRLSRTLIKRLLFWSLMRRLQLRFDFDSTAVRLLIKGH